MNRYRSGFATMSGAQSGRVGPALAERRLGPLSVRSAMKATIHHNPACGTSRKTLEILRESGADVTVNEYLKTPPSRDELKRLYDRAGITPHQGLRTRERLADMLDLAHVSETAVLEAMVDDPILIERPIVETEKGVRLCRPQDKVREIL